MRYSGKLGIAQQVEKSPGVWEETITERPVIGDLVQRSETVETSDEVLPRYRTTTSVSLLDRGVGPQNNSDLRYLTHAGRRWTISSDVSEFPNVVLYFGEEYHGPVPAEAP